MAKILCTLKNASGLINGVKFVEHELGKISEEISDEVAAAFAKIEGYVLAKEGKTSKASAKADATAAAAPAASTAATPAAQ